MFEETESTERRETAIALPDGVTPADTRTTQKCSDPQTPAKIAAEFASEFLTIAHEAVIVCKKQQMFLAHGSNHRVGEMIKCRFDEAIVDYAVTDDGTTWAAIIRPSNLDKFELMTIRRIYTIAEMRADFEEFGTRKVEQPKIGPDDDFLATLERLEGNGSHHAAASDTQTTAADETDELLGFPYLTEQGCPMLQVGSSAYFKNFNRVTIEMTRDELMSVALDYVNYFFTAKVCPHFVCCGEELKYIVDFAWQRFREIYDLMSPDAPIPLIEEYIQRWKDVDEQFDRDVEILDQPRQARPWSNSAPIQATASSNMEKRSDTQQEPTQTSFS